MKKTSVVIDEELATAVQEVLGTKTLRETIERSMLEVLRARARSEEVAALTSQRGLDLADDEIMAGAWRN